MVKKQDDKRQIGINSNEFDSAISQICDEKGIDKNKVMETVEAALAAAYKKDYGKKSQNIRAEMGKVSGQVDFYLVKEVVDNTIREFIELNKEDEDNDNKNIIGEKKEKSTNEKTTEKKEEIEDIKKDEKNKDDEDKQEYLPRFNPERDIIIEDALKIKKDAKIGDIIETRLDSHDDYGRVAAQTAKQVIIQRIREAEKEAMYNEYKEKEGEVLSGTVQRMEGRNVFVDLGKATGILFPSEQIKGENYHIGQRIKVYLEKIEVDTRGPGIVLSRISSEMVRKIFELEVPEIFTGAVEIKAIAREAGARTKIAVVANEDGLDPIGSCVGQKGTRVQAVIDELGGEKIDIIEWNEDLKKFISASLSPAKILRIDIDEKSEAKTAIAIVEEDQLSLAIGQKGQNVRLAAKLTDYRIDIISADKISDKDNKEKKEKKEDEKADKNIGKKDKKIKKDEKKEKSDKKKDSKKLEKSIKKTKKVTKKLKK